MVVGFSPLLQSKPSDDLKGLFFLQAQGALTKRLEPAEAMAEYMLISSSDEDLLNRFHFLHDWALSNENRGFDGLAKYFAQTEDKLEEALNLFKKHRNELCEQDRNILNTSKPPYKMLQLFLLYDCLLHVGAKEHGEAEVCFLSSEAPPPDFINLEQVLLQNEGTKISEIYNYAVIDNKLLIGKKGTHHSELAMGYPVDAAGELSVVRSAVTNKLTFYINNKSGHYRPEEHTNEFAASILAEELEKSLRSTDEYEIKLTNEYLHRLPFYKNYTTSADSVLRCN